MFRQIIPSQIYFWDQILYIDQMHWRFSISIKYLFIRFLAEEIIMLGTLQNILVSFE